MSRPYEIDPLILENARRQQERLELATSMATQQGPDQEAEVQSLSKKTGLDSGIIRRNLNEVRQRTAQTDPAIQQLPQTSPKTADFLSNPSNAAVASDDHHTLTFLESLYRVVDTNIGAHVALVGARRAAAALSQVAPAGLGLLETRLKATIAEEAQHKAAIEAGGVSPFMPMPMLDRYRTAMAGQLEAARKFAAGISERVRGPRSDNPFVELPLQAVESIAQMGVAAAVGFVAGPPAAIGFMGAMQAGLAGPEMLDKGADPATALLMSGLSGVAEGGFEVLPAHLIVEQLKLGGPVAKFILKELGAEVATEEPTTLFQDFFDWAADPDNKNKTLRDYVHEHDFIRPAAETLAVTVLSALGAGGITAGISRYIHNKSPQEVFLQQEGEAAKNSPLAKRSPETYADFVEGASEGTGAEKRYVAPEKIRERAAAVKMSPAALADQMTEGGAEKLEETTRLGQDVEISAKDYATRVGPSEHGAYFESRTRVGSPEFATGEEANAMRETALQDLTPEEIAAQQEIETNLQVLESPELDQAIEAALAEPTTTPITEAAEGAPAAPEAVDKAVEQAAFTRMAQFLHEVQSGATEMTGKAKREEGGKIVGRFGGGIKQMFPELKHFEESPSKIAAAIIRDQGNPLYQRVLKASEEYIERTEGDQIRQSLEGGDISFDFGEMPPEDFLDRIEREATERIRKRGVRLGAGVDPFLGADVVLIGAVKIARGVRNFAQWSAEMIEKLGEQARPYLRSLYAKSVAKAAQHLSMAPEAVREAAASIAVDAAVTFAEEEAQLTPMMTSAADLGLTEEEFAPYQAQIEKDAIQRRETLQAEYRKSFEREQTDWYKAARATMETAVQGELQSDREQIAVAYLQHGTLPDGQPLPESTPARKLDQAALEKRYGKFKDSAKMQALRALDAYRREGGEQPDVIATTLGYRSTDAMVDAVIAAPKYDDVVKTETDRRMDEKYGGVETLNAELDQKARDAVMILGRAELAERNIKALFGAMKASGRQMIRDLRRLSITEARRTAKHQTQQTASKNLNPRLHYAAARKASLAAREALIRGDLEEAFLAATRELLNLELYRAHRAAQDNLKDSRSDFQKFFKSDAQLGPTHTMDFVEVARAIAAKLFFPGRGETVEESLARLKTYAPDTHEMVMDMIPPMNFESYRDAPYGMAEALIQIANDQWRLSTRDKSSRIEGQLVEREKMVGEMKARLAQFSQRHAEAGRRGQLTKFQKFDRAALGGKAWFRRMEHWVTRMDGGPQGPFRTYLYNPVKEALNHYVVLRQEYFAKYHALLDPIRSTFNREKIDAWELGYVFGNNGKGGLAELLGALLHTGNRRDAKSNMAKFLIGRGWGEWKLDGTLDTSKWDAFIDRMHEEKVLTQAHWDFIQEIWNLFEEIKPRLQAAHREVYGYYFEEIARDPVVTPFGTYPGGYMPAIADPLAVEGKDGLDIAERNEAQMTFEDGASHALPSVGRKSTIARKVVYDPLIMDLNQVTLHIDWALRFSEIQPAVKDATKLIRDPEFVRALNANDPRARKDMILPWLQRAATQRVSMKGYSPEWDRFMTYLRSSTAAQVLTANVSVATQQFPGLLLGATLIQKKRYMASAAYRYLRAPREMSAYIREKSEYMRPLLMQSSQEIEQNIRDIMVNPSTFAKFSNWTKRYGSILAQGSQDIVNHILWLAAQEDAAQETADDREIVLHADSVIRQTQGSFSPDDLSKWEAGTPTMRLLAQFTPYFIMNANMMFTEVGVAGKAPVGTYQRVKRIAAVYTFSFMLPSLISQAILNFISGDWNDDDDDTHIDELLNFFIGAQANTAFSMLPIVGTAGRAVYGAFATEARYDDEIRAAPAIAMLTAPIGHIRKMKEEGIVETLTTDPKAARDFLNLMGIVLDKPLGMFGKPLGYFIRVQNGEQAPENVVDLARGLISGRPPKK